MKLIGNYLSPYVRRVAVSLNALSVPFEQEPVFVFKDPEAVRNHNPLVRIPALILDDGDVLVESYAILDELDQLAGAENALTPASGAARRQVMKLTAIAVGSMDKTVWAAYEGRFRPEEKIHIPWIEHNEKQALGGLEYLDGLAREAGDGRWLAGTSTISQADISGTVAYSFARTVRPALQVDSKVPHLAMFAERCEAMEIFRNAPIPEPAG